MKKFFTLIAAVALAASVNAQTTLINYPTSQSGITLHNVGGQISFATVKIHTNKDEVPCIKIGKSFSAENLVVDNFVELTTEGGFKKGDVITVSGVFNNSDNTKKLLLLSSLVKLVLRQKLIIRPNSLSIVNLLQMILQRSKLRWRKTCLA